MDVPDLVQPPGLVMRWTRSPALHFLAIGGLLFVARDLPGSLATGASDGAEPVEIVVDGSVLEAQRRALVTRIGHPLDPAGEHAVLEAIVDEEILYREAVAGELDRNDEVVRNRLVELAGFVSENPEKDEDTLVREARALGLDRSDVIVRRHLVRMMKMLLRRPAVLEPVSDADLEALLDREPERFGVPPALTLTHVFVSTTRRGATAEPDARALLAALRGEDVDPGDAPGRGDPFPLGHRFADASARDLRKAFGARFVELLEGAETGAWTGPLRSGFGEHLVFVHERRPARRPSLDDSVRKRLVLRLHEVRGEERLREALERLRARYVVRVETSSPKAVVASAAPAIDLPRPQAYPGD